MVFKVVLFDLQHLELLVLPLNQPIFLCSLGLECLDLGFDQRLQLVELTLKNDLLVLEATDFEGLLVDHLLLVLIVLVEFALEVEALLLKLVGELLLHLSFE